jgi:hypothetical protein
MKNKLIAALALTSLYALNSQHSTARAQSPFGNAVSLDGVNQYVSVPTAAGSAVNSPLTIEAWVYVRAYASWSRLMDFGNGPGTDNIVCALSSEVSGQPRFSFWNGSGGGLADLISPSPLPLNAWRHLAFTYDGTNGRIFINGDLAASGPMSAPPIVTRTNNFIGRSNWGDPYANAIIDEFRIWSVARSPAQIQASRSSPLVGNEAGLLLYYKFDSASGTVATNSATATGAAYNGTLVNSPGWVPGSTPPSSLVTNTSDAGAGSLREAINTTPSGGLIYFAPNLSGQTITLTTGQLLVTNVLTIDAFSLASPPIISGNNASRVLLVTNNAVLALKSLIIANGLATRDLSLGIVTNFGGGIYNSTNCNLTLTRCLLSGNTAAALAAPYAGEGSSFGGGGIYNAGTLTLNQSTLSGNSALGDRLGAPTRQGAGWGGGIYNVGTLALHQSSIVTNQAYGGDVPQQTDSASGGNAAGGGIYNAGTLTLDESSLSGNSTRGGNSTHNPDPSRNGGNGGNASGGGLYNAGPATLSGCTLSGNSNTGGIGGSAYSVSSSSGNAGDGGSANGAGLFNMSTITLNNCTLAGNTDTGGNGGPAGYLAGAGGDANCGGIATVGPATLVNCTLSGNSATGGSGSCCSNPGTAPGPNGASNGGGIYTTTTNATLHNSLIAQNTGGGSPDLSGSFTSLGYNLIGTINGSQGIVAGSNGDLAGTTAAPLNPMLSPLGTYGGPTLTMALQFGSPAMDAGDNSVTAILATDQRGAGYPRANFLNVDIGAFEFGNGDSSPSIISLSAGSLLLNPTTHLGSLTISASVNPNAIDAPATVWVQYGVSTAYGVTTTPLALNAGISYVPLSQPLTNLAPALTWHYRWVAVNYLGTTYSPDQTVTVGTPGGGVSGILGDADGNGVVSQAELDRVYASYVTNSPWLYMTNVAGLGGTNVTFSLSNSVLGAYSIQYSTNLVNWYYLGPATPRYLFTDTNAPALPQRYYRLRYP